MKALTSHASLQTRTLDALLPEWRTWVATMVWQVYLSLDPDAPLLTVRKWILAYTIRVRDARPLMVLLFGEPPQ